MLDETVQAQKDKYHVFSRIWNQNAMRRKRL